jgi:sec-independent protein translocase protein TatB
MPGLVRAIGRWTGKARGYVRNLTAELERETHLAEMKKQIEDAHRILREQSAEVRSNVELNLKAIREGAHSAGSAETSADPVMKPLSAASIPAEPALPNAQEKSSPASPAATPSNHYGP